MWTFIEYFFGFVMTVVILRIGLGILFGIYVAGKEALEELKQENENDKRE